MSFRQGLLAFVFLSAVVGCGGLPVGKVATIAVRLDPVGGSGVSGEVIFYELDGGVLVEGSFKGLTPRRGHGFHLHEKGDCSGPGAEAAGGHFNPGGKAHGRWDADEHHIGDFPNLVGKPDGQDTTSFVVEDMTFRKGRTAIVGRSVIVHANRDDGLRQPDGGAGPALACGIIGGQ